MTSPPHACLKSGRVISDEHGCGAEPLTQSDLAEAWLSERANRRAKDAALRGSEDPGALFGLRAATALRRLGLDGGRPA